MAFDNKKKFRAKVTHCRFLGLCLFFTLVIIPHQIILNKKSFIIIFLIFRKFRINSKKSRNPDPFFQRKIFIKKCRHNHSPHNSIIRVKVLSANIMFLIKFYNRLITIYWVIERVLWSIMMKLKYCEIQYILKETRNNFMIHDIGIRLRLLVLGRLLDTWYMS